MGKRKEKKVVVATLTPFSTEEKVSTKGFHLTPNHLNSLYQWLFDEMEG